MFGSFGATTITSGNALAIRSDPAARTLAGDVQMIAASAITIVGNVTSEVRSVTNVFHDPANLSVTPGAAVNAPTISTLATVPYARLRAQVQGQADGPDLWTANLTQNSAGQQRAVSSVRSRYGSGAATIDMGAPDVGGTSGWQSNRGPLVGDNTFWNVSLTGWLTANNGLVDGAACYTVQRQGTFTP